jgi:hypothetical protein
MKRGSRLFVVGQTDSSEGLGGSVCVLLEDSVAKGGYGTGSAPLQRRGRLLGIEGAERRSGLHRCIDGRRNEQAGVQTGRPFSVVLTPHGSQQGARDLWGGKRHVRRQGQLRKTSCHSERCCEGHGRRPAPIAISGQPPVDNITELSRKTRQSLPEWPTVPRGHPLGQLTDTVCFHWNSS